MARFRPVQNTENPNSVILILWNLDQNDPDFFLKTGSKTARLIWTWIAKMGITESKFWYGLKVFKNWALVSGVRSWAKATISCLYRGYLWMEGKDDKGNSWLTRVPNTITNATLDFKCVNSIWQIKLHLSVQASRDLTKYAVFTQGAGL